MGNKLVSALAFAIAVTHASLAPAAETAQPSPGGCRLTQVATVPLLIYPGADAVYVRASLNTVPKILRVDTDTEASLISMPLFKELRLEAQVARADDPFYARPPNRVLFANVVSLIIGTLPPRAMQFRIAEGPLSSLDSEGTVRPAFANFDVEFDFAAARMNLFQPSACVEGPYWTNSGAAALNIEISRSGLFRFPLMLDGKRVSAAIDTARTLTALSKTTAQSQFNVDPEQSDVVLHSLATEDGGIAIGNPRLHLRDTPEADAYYVPADVYLGMVTLRQLHFYIAYARRKLFITAASGPPAVNMRQPISQHDDAAPPSSKPVK